MNSLRILLGFISVLALLYGCSNSDDYLFNGAEDNEISVEAFITRSFDVSVEKKKTDTICPGDSLIFLTEINPSKSIRKQEYYWTLDGNHFASEFSFKKAVTKPGLHKIAFVFIDIFGDTLSDTLSLHVASPPVLDTKNLIPANNTQEIFPNDFVNFAWIAEDPDSRWNISYRFVLKDLGYNNKDTAETLVDTILNQPYFTYTKGLKTLNKYQWNVFAVNELHQAALDSITANFFTAGLVGEGGIIGGLAASSNELGLTYHLSLIDELGKSVYDNTSSSTGFGTASFRIAPVIPGKYKLYVSLENYPDFNIDTVNVQVKANQVLQLDSIRLWDVVKASIRSIENKDTLDYADTLKFLVKDGGGKVSLSRISVALESNVIQNTSMVDETLFVSMESSKYVIDHAWTPKMLYIKAQDQSANKSVKTFYIRPGTSFQEVYNE